MRKTPSGFAASVLAYLLWGFITIYWKQLTHFNAFELIGHRILWSSVLLTVVIVASSKWRAVLSAGWRGLRSAAARASWPQRRPVRPVVDDIRAWLCRESAADIAALGDLLG